jgi:hypothetical protein
MITRETFPLSQEIESQGYCLVKNILSKDEIEGLRQIVSQHFEQDGLPANGGLTQSNAAVAVPELMDVFYHPKILTLMRQLLHQEQIMFTSHCDIHSRTLGGWHKDDGMTVMEGGYFGEATYDVENCRVYKVAIYLQDHHNNLGGLRVRRGSHRLAALDRGEEVYLQTKAGDILFFDARLTHTGQTEVVPIPWLIKPIGILRRIIHKVCKVEFTGIDTLFRNIYDRIAGDRLSIFFTFGSPNEWTIKFAQNNMRRQLSQFPNAPIYLSESLRQNLLNRDFMLAEDYFSDIKSLETVNK